MIHFYWRSWIPLVSVLSQFCLPAGLYYIYHIFPEHRFMHCIVPVCISKLVRLYTSIVSFISSLLWRFCCFDVEGGLVSFCVVVKSVSISFMFLSGLEVYQNISHRFVYLWKILAGSWSYYKYCSGEWKYGQYC